MQGTYDCLLCSQKYAAFRFFTPSTTIKFLDLIKKFIKKKTKKKNKPAKKKKKKKKKKNENKKQNKQTNKQTKNIFNMWDSTPS